MDKLDEYRELIVKILSYYASLPYTILRTFF